jgi:hypothetical protein
MVRLVVIASLLFSFFGMQIADCMVTNPEGTPPEGCCIRAISLWSVDANGNTPGSWNHTITGTHDNNRPRATGTAHIKGTFTVAPCAAHNLPEDTYVNYSVKVEYRDRNGWSYYSETHHMAATDGTYNLFFWSGANTYHVMDNTLLPDAPENSGTYGFMIITITDEDFGCRYSGGWYITYYSQGPRVINVHFSDNPVPAHSYVRGLISYNPAQWMPGPLGFSSYTLDGGAPFDPDEINIELKGVVHVPGLRTSYIVTYNNSLEDHTLTMYGKLTDAHGYSEGTDILTILALQQ